MQRYLLTLSAFKYFTSVSDFVNLSVTFTLTHSSLVFKAINKFAIKKLVLFFIYLGQIVMVAMQMLVWMTPIMWDTSMFSSSIIKLLKINPMFYIVEGYRNSFIYHTWFWENSYVTIWFWGVTISFMLLGAFVFKKLRPHFADVL